MALHKNLKKKWVKQIKGYGIFATKDINKGELVMIDEGKTLTLKEYFLLLPAQQNLCYQIDEDIVLSPKNLKEISEEWFVNHSCNPNTKYDNGKWFAIENIKKGEELTHDYALLWTNDLAPFEINPCLCGSNNCRGKMTGDDWKNPELQKRYEDQFLPYLQKKISKGHRFYETKKRF